MSKMIFLNKDVEKEVVSNHELYVAWRLAYSHYDDDIDPLHNPDWVRWQQRREAQHLEDLKLKILDFKAELDEFNISGRLIKTQNPW